MTHITKVSLKQILDLSKDLIRIPSVTGNKEMMNNVIDLVKEKLGEFPQEEFLEPHSETKSLLFFNTSKRPKKFRVILNGHLDVVSGKKDQFNPHIKNGKLYGRGAYDMKAAVAVELLVFKYLAKSLNYPIGLQLVTDEEAGGFNGTAYQITQGVQSDIVISGESTELDINNERKGVLVLEITTYGKSAHAAYLHQGNNAVVKMVQLITNLSREFPIQEKEEWTTSANIAGIYTQNSEHNKVPDTCKSLIDFRHVPSDTKEKLVRKVQNMAPKGTNIRIDKQGFTSYADPAHPDLVLLSKSIKSVTEKPVNFIKKSGSSDSRHFAEVGSVTVDFGPSGYGLHTDLEYGFIESYRQYAKALFLFLSSLK